MSCRNLPVIPENGALDLLTHYAPKARANTISQHHGIETRLGIRACDEFLQFSTRPCERNNGLPFRDRF